MVWTPARFAWSNGGTAVGLIPTRYPGAETHSDPQIQLARRTDWQEPGGDAAIGSGQRLLATEADDFPLMDIRHIALSPAAESAASDSAGPPS